MLHPITIVKLACIYIIFSQVTLHVNHYFPLGSYLVVITKKTLIGLIRGHEVWVIKGTDVLAFPRATLHLTESQVHGDFD